ncbi:AI-2E family transporter [Patescibacteria group bacterium]
MSNDTGRVLDISWAAILKISVVILCFYLLYLTRDLLVWFLFSLIVSILFNPVVNFLCRFKVPRVLSVIFVYLAAFSFISYLVFITASLLIAEIQQFLDFFPQYFEKVSPVFRGLGLKAFQDLETFSAAATQILEKMAVNIFNAFFAIFGGIFSTILVVTIAIFLSLEDKAVEKTLSLLFPKKYEAYVMNLWTRSQKQVSGWFLSRVIGCLFVSVVSYVSFLILAVKYPFSLALLAGVLNFIPVVGPVITAAILFLVTFLSSLSKALFVLIIFILIQQIENNIITPLLSQKFIGLPPVLVLLALSVGGVLWGFLGAILSIPLFGILFEFLKEFLKKRKKEEAVVL